jgi:hypothetical protein
MKHYQWFVRQPIPRGVPFPEIPLPAIFIWLPRAWPKRIAFGETSDLVPTPGIELVGPLPAEIQNFTVLSAGIGAETADPAAAKRLILLLSSPAVHPVLRESGLEPPR